MSISSAPSSLGAVIAPTTCCRGSWASGLQPAALLRLLRSYKATTYTLPLIGE